jgi:endonuclease YncB( thermonuclease family)
MPSRFVVSLAFVLLLVPVKAFAQELPAGVPHGAEKATVTGYVDGDKFKIRRNKHGEVVLLAGIDALESGECFFTVSSAQLKKLLPKKTTIYLERSGDDRDGKDRLIRYVWIPGEHGKKATLLNPKLVREGFAGFDDGNDNPTYFNRLEELQQGAQNKRAGL